MMSSANDLAAAAGQVLVGGFPGEGIHEEFASLVRDGVVGGVILFSGNLSTLEATAALVEGLTALPAPEPLWLAIDQEGGRVQRLRAPFPELPPMRAFGDAK